MKTFTSYLIEEALDKALPPSARDAIVRVGGKIYQIGGVVRDEMLGKVSKDLDLLVVGVELEKLGKALEPFGKVNLVGKSFGIIKFKPEGTTEEIDISIPRIDSKSTGKGHKDFEIKLGKGITLEQDQLRRDFWMNAMSKDIETGEVHDIEGRGKLDIENKVVRMINPQAFQDDPLRMLRAVQFAARFDFKIEPVTYNEIKKNVKLLKTVSAERFQEEFVKLFTKSKSPSYGLKLMVELGMMKVLFSQVKKIDKRVLDKIGKAYFPAFLGVFLQDYGKQAGTVAQKAMKVSNDVAASVNGVVRVILDKKIMSDEVKLVDWGGALPSHVIDNIDGYLLSIKANPLSKVLNDMRKKGKPTSLKELPINGRDLMGLGIKGTKVGSTLRWALEYSIRNGGQTRDELLKIIQKDI